MTLSASMKPVDSAAEPAFAALLEELTNKCLAGEAVDWSAYVQAHAEHAAELRRLLPAMQAIADLGRSAGKGDAAFPDALDGVQDRLGDFRILREIGRGGMGVVYEAEQLSLGRRVALKVLPFAATLDAKQLLRFQNEARAAGYLQHQNIVPVHYVGCERGVHFYAMQFIEGQTLAAVIAELRQWQRESKGSGVRGQGSEEGSGVRGKGSENLDGGRKPANSLLSGGREPPERAAAGQAPAAETTPHAGLATEQSISSRAFFRSVAALGEQAATGLEHAHQLGVIHRDIKPANLLIDVRGNLWIADFGLAQFQKGSPLTLTGDMVGTLRYMSPEQALAKRGLIDHRSDVYALGVTLYELLTLQPAFPGDDRQELLRQIALDDPAPARRLNKAIPAELETIVGKALEKNPAERYATAQELADDLRRFLEDKAIQARRPGVMTRVRKWGRRHKPVVWSAVAVFAMALAVTGFIAWTMHDRNSRRAETERVIEAALREEESLRNERKYPEALLAACRATDLLAGGEVSTELRRRVEERLVDQKMIARLEDIRSQTRSTIKEDGFDSAGAIQEYARAFRDYGIDLEVLPREQAGAQIAARNIRVELVLALDEWMILSMNLKSVSPTWKHLLVVARAADDDPIRGRLRDIVEQQDKKGLGQLASSVSMEDLPVPTVVFVGRNLRNAGALSQALTVLRVAQRRHPGDFWINYELALTCGSMKPPLWYDAARFFSAALAIRPGNVRVLSNLGVALHRKGALAEAEATYQIAICLKPDYAIVYYNLGLVLEKQGRLVDAVTAQRKASALMPRQPDSHYALGVALEKLNKPAEAAEAYRKAIALKPDYAWAHNNLGRSLATLQQLPEAAEAFRKAIALQSDDADAYTNLGAVLSYQHKLDEAVAAHQRAIQLQPGHAVAHYNLGLVLADLGKWAQASAAYRKAIELKPDYVEPYCEVGDILHKQQVVQHAVACLGDTLQVRPALAKAFYGHGYTLGSQGKLAGVEQAYRSAIVLKPDYAQAHCNLGGTLLQQGRFLAALDCRKRGHALGSRTPGWSYPSAEWVQEAEAFVRLDPRLRLYLEGNLKASGPAECFHLAKLCQLECRRLHAAAARFYREAFTAEPPGRRIPHYYDAACNAALAGCGKGNDAQTLNPQERFRLREQACAWLLAELNTWKYFLDTRQDQARMAVSNTMGDWQHDPDLEDVRSSLALAKLPEGERQAWQRFWPTWRS